MKKIWLSLLLMLFIGVLSSCDQESNHEPKTYTVVFNVNGGSTITSQTVEENGFAEEPTPPTKNGYLFKYWYIDDEGASFDFELPITSNVTLNALWEEAMNEDEVLFDQQFEFLDQNNYALEIEILKRNPDYQYELIPTVVSMYFAGDLTRYVDGSYEAIYHRLADEVHVYVKQGDAYDMTVEDRGEPLFFYTFEYAWFTKLEDSFVMKVNAYDYLDSFIDLGEGLQSIKNVQIMLGETYIEHILFDIQTELATYGVTLTFQSFGDIEVTLPEMEVE